MAKIYVACLASYNNARHHGEWFDLEDYCDAEDLQKAVKEKVLMTSPYPNVLVECPDCEGAGTLETVGHCHSDERTVLCERCQGTGKVTSAEEWAIHDYDDDTGIFRTMGEYPSLEDIMHHVQMMEKHEGWAAFVGHYGDSVTEENYEDAVRGQYDSFEDFCQEWISEVYGWKGDEAFYNWLDWEKIERDLGHDFTYVDGWVFYDSF